MLILDSGGLSYLAKRNQDAAATIRVFVRDGLWPPVVPSVVLAESITGRQRDDANLNRLLKTCDIVGQLPEEVARRAGELRFRPDGGLQWTRSSSPPRSQLGLCSLEMTRISTRWPAAPIESRSSASELVPVSPFAGGYCRQLSIVGTSDGDGR